MSDITIGHFSYTPHTKVPQDTIDKAWKLATNQKDEQFQLKRPNLAEMQRVMDTIDFAARRFMAKWSCKTRLDQKYNLYLGQNENRALAISCGHECMLSNPTVMTREYMGFRVVVVDEVSHIGFGHSDFKNNR